MLVAIRSLPDKLCLHCNGLMPRRNMRMKKFCSRACNQVWRAIDGERLFWLKVDKSAGPDGCWLYMGFRKWDGYGWLARYVNGKSKWLTAHRYAWILTNGEPPLGLHIMHKCDNPPCCNPAHLALGTHQDNMADRVAKGRHRMGRIYKDRVRPERKAA